jgi:hypothetical protein
MAYGPHCGRPGCQCTHDRYADDGCYAGVVDVVLLDGREAARPCPTCRPEQARIVAEARSPEEAGRRLRARSVGDPYFA